MLPSRSSQRLAVENVGGGLGTAADDELRGGREVGIAACTGAAKRPEFTPLEHDGERIAARGQTVRVELQAFAGGPKHEWHNDRAYFDEIRVVSQ